MTHSTSAACRIKITFCVTNFHNFSNFCRKTNARSHLCLHLHQPHGHQLLLNHQTFSNRAPFCGCFLSNMRDFDCRLWQRLCSLGSWYVGINRTAGRGKSKFLPIQNICYCNFSSLRTFCVHLENTTSTRHQLLATTGSKQMETISWSRYQFLESLRGFFTAVRGLKFKLNILFAHIFSSVPSSLPSRTRQVNKIKTHVPMLIWLI